MHSAKRKGVVYKRCCVPTCKNSSLKSPEKHFFYVPKDNQYEWCQALGISHIKKYSLNICEDHLNLEKDLQNYLWWKTVGGNAKLKARVPVFKNIGNLQYTCVQCLDCDLCMNCESYAHESHYLLRVPKDKSESEVQSILQSIRSLLSDENYLTTEYINTSLTDRDSDEDITDIQTENNVAEIEYLDEDADLVTNIITPSRCHLKGSFSEPNEDISTINKYEKNIISYENFKREMDDLEDASISGSSANRNIVLVPKPGQKVLPKERNLNGIWFQYQGKPTPLDNEATNTLINLVHSDKYQKLFQMKKKRKDVWRLISKEMIDYGFQFGDRDPGIVCAQKWRNLEHKFKNKNFSVQ